MRSRLCVCLTCSCFDDCFSRNVGPSTGPSSSGAPRRCQVLDMDCQYTWGEVSQGILHGQVYRLVFRCNVCCPASVYLLRRPQTDMATENLCSWNIETESQRGLGSNRPCSKITKVNLMFTGTCIVIIFQYIIPTRCTSNRVYLTLRLLMSYIYIYIYIWSTYSWCF